MEKTKQIKNPKIPKHNPRQSPQPQTKNHAHSTCYQGVCEARKPAYVCFLYKWKTTSTSFTDNHSGGCSKNNNSLDWLFTTFPLRSFTVSCVFIAAEKHSSQLPLLTTAFPACSFSLLLLYHKAAQF